MIWLLLLAVWSVLLVDIFLVGKDNSVLVAMGGAFGIFWLLITLYVFQLQARFENSVQNTLLNSFLLAVKNWLSTLQLAGITAMVPALIVFLAVGIPGCAWLVLFPVCVCRIFRNCLV